MTTNSESPNESVNMMQIICKQSTGRICDGTCGHPCCLVAHNRQVVVTYSGCPRCADYAAQAERIAQLDARIENFKRVCEEWSERYEAAQSELAAARQEIETLRQYGNKDCTAMADAAIAARTHEAGSSEAGLNEEKTK